MSFRITPEDVGRKAIDGMSRVLTITEFDLTRNFPVKARLTHNGTLCDTDLYAIDGKWGTKPTNADIIAWADELATDKDRPKDLRDEFAMVAMRMLYATDSMIKATSDVATKHGVDATEMVAKLAYEYADAMMKARGK